MYEMRQYKNIAGAMVSRQLECGTRQRGKFEDRRGSTQENASFFRMRQKPIQQFSTDVKSILSHQVVQTFNIKNQTFPCTCIQRKDPPTTKERTKSAIVTDKHNIPHPFWDLGSWYKTLMTARIADLYRTAGGFLGHAAQVQQELNRLIPLIEDGMFLDPVSLLTAVEYERNIRKFIVRQARKVRFDFPKFIFTFSRNVAVAVERTKGKFIGG